MATFDSSGVGSDVSPSYPPKLTVQNNLIKVTLGDGYEQRLQKGIKNRTNTVTTNILNFLADANKGNNGQKAFDWSPPFGATGKWTCENPVVTIVSNDLNNIDLEFREVFEP